MEAAIPFLKRLVSDLISMYGEDRTDLCIVLPGKRARLFLYRAWAEAAKKPVWAPKVLTMEEFVFGTLSYEPVDELETTLNLWDICRGSSTGDITFEQFSGWASIIFRDFNEVDLFLADPDQVFINLLEAKELQLWSPGEQHELSPYEQQYILFYEMLLPWYNDLRKLLIDRKRAYQGLGFRLLAENSDSLIREWEGQNLVFAGFNAFTPSEEKIIHTLEKAGIASMRWDADTWYLEDEMQEAGHFLRSWIRKHPARDFNWMTNDIREGKKEICVSGVHGHRAQARVAGEILANLHNPSSNVAVILPDESLLMPLLNAIPPNVEAFNVTMGLPIRHTPAMSWLNLNLNLFSRPGRNPAEWVRVVNLLPVIRHPWFIGLTIPTESDGEKERHREPCGLLTRRFYQFEELSELFSVQYPGTASLLRSFFSPADSPTRFLDKMEMTMRHMISGSGMEDRPFDRGSMLETLRLLKLIRQTLERCPQEEDGFLMLRYLFGRMIQPASIPFTGEPLKGVQILGLLETRNLDFDHVIILSVNEKILPAARKPLSLIPADIRRFHGLPGVHYQDAIFAYHFYHLIQRAKKVDIIYNTDLSINFSGEMSRFIRQIEAELVPANLSMTYKHQRLSDELNQLETAAPITIGKNGAVFEALVESVENRGLSPSQIGRYIQCPLMFYFGFVANLEEPANLEEAIDHKELGTLIHNTLQELYDPATHPGHDANGEKVLPLTNQFFADALKIADERVAFHTKKLLGGASEITGKNLIIMEVAKFMVKRFLENEQKLISEHRIDILAVEKKLEKILDVESNGRKWSVRCKGFADRIDRFDGVTRITDYKTGKVEMKGLKFDDIDALFSDPGLLKAMQLMFYTWLYTGESHAFPLTAGIFTLKSPGSYFLGIPSAEGVTPQEFHKIIGEFEEGLKRVCAEILNPNVPFSATEVTETCKMCPYHPVCLTAV
jgi:ATP-dependent helicase/nuclease subunit B